MESAIESCRKRGVFFIELYEIRRTSGVEIAPTLSQSLSGSGFRELLTGKDERHVSAFTAQGHTVGKGALSSHPANVYAERLVDPGACDVKILVAKGFDHAEKLLFRFFARHFRDQSNDSGHILSLSSFLNRLQLASIPEAPNFQELPDNGLRNLASEPAVEAKFEGDFSFKRKGNVIPWQPELLKAASPLELGEGALRVFVNVVAIHEVRYSLL